MTCRLERTTIGPSVSPELRQLLEEQAAAGITYDTFLHHQNGKTLILNSHISVYSLEDAHIAFMGVRRWRTMSVGVKGSLQARLADAKAIGRGRGAGERSPAPLPDWYDLTHVVYEHARETGFDPTQPVWQLLPPPDWPYINFAESLHMRQPA